MTVSLGSWGDELYGTIPVKIAPENSQEECEIGDIAYWLDGSGFCILYGKTPVSMVVHVPLMYKHFMPDLIGAHSERMLNFVGLSHYPK